MIIRNPTPKGGTELQFIKNTTGMCLILIGIMKNLE